MVPDAEGQIKETKGRPVIHTHATPQGILQEICVGQGGAPPDPANKDRVDRISKTGQIRRNQQDPLNQ